MITNSTTRYSAVYFVRSMECLFAGPFADKSKAVAKVRAAKTEGHKRSFLKTTHETYEVVS